MWCVIECGSKGEIFEPEFFQNEKEAMKYIVDDSKNAMQCILTFLMFWLIMTMTNSKHRFGRMNLVLDGKHLIFLIN